MVDNMINEAVTWLFNDSQIGGESESSSFLRKISVRKFLVQRELQQFTTPSLIFIP